MKFSLLMTLGLFTGVFWGAVSATASETVVSQQSTDASRVAVSKKETKKQPSSATVTDKKTAAKSGELPTPKDNPNTENNPTAGDHRQTAVVWQAVLKVVNPNSVREQIAQAAKDLGGHPTFFDDTRIVLKLPKSTTDTLTKQIAEMGLVLEKNINRTDLTLRIAEITGRLKSKQEMLEKTRSFLDDADVSATLDIERTMTQLVLETESLRGELRLLRDQAAFAKIIVNFEFRQRDKVRYINSPFEWLGTVDLGRFVEEFQP